MTFVVNWELKTNDLYLSLLCHRPPASDTKDLLPIAGLIHLLLRRPVFLQFPLFRYPFRQQETAHCSSEGRRWKLRSSCALIFQWVCTRPKFKIHSVQLISAYNGHIYVKQRGCTVGHVKEIQILHFDLQRKSTCIIMYWVVTPFPETQRVDEIHVIK